MEKRVTAGTTGEVSEIVLPCNEPGYTFADHPNKGRGCEFAVATNRNISNCG
jgi:hypothetical protein